MIGGLDNLKIEQNCLEIPFAYCDVKDDELEIMIFLLMYLRNFYTELRRKMQQQNNI